MILLSGCTGLQKTPVDAKPRKDGCLSFLGEVDHAVKRGNSFNAAYEPIPDAPYLRSNRFWSAYAKRVLDRESSCLLLENMFRLNCEAREKEIRNLPTDILQKVFDSGTSRTDLSTKAKQCAKVLFDQIKGEPDLATKQLARSEVSQEYSNLMRVLGVYPLAALPVAYLTHKARREFQEWFDRPISDLPISGNVLSFSPKSSVTSSSPTIQNLLESFSTDPTAIFKLSSDQIKGLAHAMAPIIVQDVAGIFDQFGEVVWKGNRVDVNTDKPTLYFYKSYAFLKETPVLQFNYVLWYEGRRGSNAPWIERGPLDGLTIRITLGSDGTPAMADIMNNCGCYHLFVPKKGLIKGIRKKTLAIDAFSPQVLPASFPALPLRVRVISGWHQVARVYTAQDNNRFLFYELLPYDVLESLPHTNGQHESVFNDRGIMKGSERIEPLLLFSMGVPKVGYMRQRGNHAISLVGREHFDDPYLFEKNFIVNDFN